MENSSSDVNTRPPDLPPEKSVCRSRNMDMEQQARSKFRKEYIKAVYFQPVYLTYMQSTSYEMQGWKKHKLKSRFLGEISISSDKQMTPSLRQKAIRTKELPDEGERGE